MTFSRPRIGIRLAVRPWLLGVAAVIGVAAGTLFAPGVVALASAADFNPAAGTYTVDTTALTLTGPGPTNIPGTNQGGIAVWSFGNVNIPAGATLNVSGNLPFKLLASGTMTVAGVINGSGGSEVNFLNLGTSTPIPGGPGGGAGGQDVTHPGAGSGGGGVASSGSNGGGGGGFGGAGAPGGICVSSDANCMGGVGTGIPGPAGTVYGDLNSLFQGGSGGGGASSGAFDAVSGGGGGGAIGLFGSTVTIPASGQVLANGGNGAVGGFGASGGGSGGGILVHGNTVNVAGLLSAAGGQGGAGGCCGDGGGGGGGRIALQYITLTMTGTPNVSGGTSGTASDPVGFGHGGQSTLATGASGAVTQLQGEIANTLLATAVTPTTAMLNATINPNSSITTYHFQYGTTTAYGLLAPAADAVIGSDATIHAATQMISGLSPSTTYHYRVVATDGLGLVATGSDVTFTTPPPPPPTSSVSGMTTNGPAATFTFTCQDTFGQVCAGGFTATAHEHTLGGTVMAVTAAKHRKKHKPKPKVVAITLGSGSYSVPAGKSETVTFRLNKTGQHLLARFYSLPATVKFTPTSGTSLATRKVRFVYPRIKAPVAFNFLFHPTFTTVAELSASGVPAHGKVALICHGGGCPFGKRMFHGQPNLAKAFGKAQLSPGTVVEVSITARNQVGEVIVFTIQAGAAPTQKQLCLPPGAAKPSKCAS
jgi:hypothetical protein